MTKVSKAEIKEARRKTGVIVLGMHRSGTSALGGVLNLLGCDAPATLMAPHETNPKGFFESQVLYKLNDQILISGGSVWSDWQPFNPGWFESPKAEMFRENLQEALAGEFPDSRLFVLKDPRLCKLLPLYLDAFGEMAIRPAIVHIHRNPMEVAASLHSRDKLEPELGQLIWLRHVLDAESNSRSLPRSFLSYDQLLLNWGGVVDRLGKELKINWPRLSAKASNDIDAFLTPSLRHHDKPKEQLLDNPLAAGWVRETYAILQRWAESGETKADHEVLDRINGELTRSASTFAKLIESGKSAAEKARKAEADLGTARTELSGKQASLTEASEQKAKLEQKIADVSAELAEARAKADTEAEGQRKAHEQTVAQLRTEAEKKQAEAESLNATVTKLNSDLDKKRAEAENLTATVTDLNSELDQKRADHVALQAELARADHRIAETEGLLQDAAQTAERLNETVKLAEERAAQISDLRERLQSAEHAKQAAEDMSEAAKAETLALENEISLLRSTLLQRQHEAQDWANIAKAAENARDTQAALFKANEDRLTQELAILGKEIVRLEDSLNAGREERETLVSRHKDDTAGLNAELTNVTQALETEKAAQTELRKRLTRQTNELAILSQELTKAEDLLAKERARTRSEEDRLRNTVAEQARELDTYSDHLRKARSAEERVRQEAQAKDALKDALLAERAEELAHLKQVRDALLTSTSWKITAPIRRIVRLVRGGR